MAAISHLISQLWLQAAGQTHCLGQPGLGEEWSGLTDLPLLHRETACLQITHTASHPAASLQQSSSFWSGYKSLAKRGRHHIPHLILTTDLQNTIIFSRLRFDGGAEREVAAQAVFHHQLHSLGLAEGEKQAFHRGSSDPTDPPRAYRALGLCTAVQKDHRKSFFQNPKFSR